MPAQSPPPYAPHSAVLSLTFALLQQVVQRHLLPDGRPLALDFASADQQHYQATLSNCLVLPALNNQCALVFHFDRLATAGPRYKTGALQVEITCLVGLVTQPGAGKEGPCLTFDCRLSAESGGELRGQVGLRDPWPEYPGLSREVGAALLPALESVVHSRLRFNLCQVQAPPPPGPDTLLPTDAVLVDFAVLSGLSPRLDLYYAAAGSYAYGPVGEAVPALLPPTKTNQPEANAGLLIGNEQLLQTLVLPSFQHLFQDYVNYRPAGEPLKAPVDFAQLFRIGRASDDEALALPGTLRATNTVLLLPRYVGPQSEAAAKISHTVNPGDLVVDIDDHIRVSIVYTLGLEAGTAKMPEAVIKIRQCYAFRLLLGSSPFDLVLESSKLDVWGEATQPDGVFKRFHTQLTQIAKDYLVQRTMAELFGVALRYLTGGLRPPRPLQGLGALPAAIAEGSVVPASPPAELNLTFYAVDAVRPFATTVIPPGLTWQAAPAALAVADAAGPKRGKKAARSKPADAALGAEGPPDAAAPVSQTLSLDLKHHPAVAELNRLLVELRTSENLLDYFYSYTLRELLFGTWRVTLPGAGLLYDYALDFASQFCMMGGYLKQQLLRYSGIDATANAILARLFYGPDYVVDSLRYDQLRAGLERALDRTLLPALRNHQYTNLVSVSHQRHGLWMQFHIAADKLQVPVRPLIPCPALKQPPAGELTAKAAAAQRRIAERASEQLTHQWPDFNAAFDAFFSSVGPDEPDSVLSELARAQQQDQHQLDEAIKALSAYLNYATEKVRMNGQLIAADAETEAEMTKSINQAASATKTGLAQAYRAIQNDAVLRLRLRDRWDQPTFPAELLKEKKASLLTIIEQAYLAASNHSTHGWGKDDAPPLSSLTDDLRQPIALLCEQGEALAKAGKSLNGNLRDSSQLYFLELENTPGLKWEMDDLFPVIVPNV